MDPDTMDATTADLRRRAEETRTDAEREATDLESQADENEARARDLRAEQDRAAEAQRASESL